MCPFCGTVPFNHYQSNSLNKKKKALDETSFQPALKRPKSNDSNDSIELNLTHEKRLFHI